MSEHLRSQINGLYAAYARCSVDFVLNAIDDDIDFVSYAPTQFFPYLGHHRGKPEFARTMQAAHALFEFLTYKPVLLIVEDDNAGAMLSMRLKQRANDRIIHLFVAQFMRFRNGRMFELREFMDTFDAVQQVLGQEIKT